MIYNAGPRQTLGATWLESEELAYATHTGSSHGSARRARVRFPDGALRIVRAGVADTYFTIPAHGRMPGRGYVAGHVYISDPGQDDSEFTFTYRASYWLTLTRSYPASYLLTATSHTGITLASYLFQSEWDFTSLAGVFGFRETDSHVADPSQDVSRARRVLDRVTEFPHRYRSTGRIGSQLSEYLDVSQGEGDL